jgi:hypothetical protein
MLYLMARSELMRGVFEEQVSEIAFGWNLRLPALDLLDIQAMARVTLPLPLRSALTYV